MLSRVRRGSKCWVGLLVVVVAACGGPTNTDGGDGRPPGDGTGDGITMGDARDTGTDAPTFDTPTSDTPTFDTPTFDQQDVSSGDSVDVVIPTDSADVIVPTDGPPPGDVVDVVTPTDGGDVVDASDAPDVACPVGQTLCMGVCTNTLTDTMNCGLCGMACAAGQVCSAGACMSSCLAPMMMCGARCVDPRTDGANCGMCGRMCGAGQTCTAGLCACPAGQSLCGMTCRNLVTDPANCGMCGTTCAMRANATASCAMSACGFACNAGFGNCNMMAGDGCEVNTSTAVANCGMCGRVCASGANAMATCAAGTCGLACNAGFGNCNMMAADGCEINLGVSVANCGMCGRACPVGANAVPTCTVGVCGLTCNMGFGNCDMLAANGCEANFNTDRNNCGVCGNACAGNQTCAAGMCVLTNNSCAAAAPIMLGAAGTTTLVSGTTVGSTDSAQTCMGGGDVWYAFTLVTQEIVYVDTFGTSTMGYNPVVGFAAACGAAQQSCSDDACMTLNSQTATVFGPGTHMIIVDANTGAGPFTLRIQHMPVSGGPAGALPMGPILINANTTGAPTRVFSCGGGMPQPERYYVWPTCPTFAGGMLTATTCTGATYDSVLEARDTNAAGATCNDNSMCGGMATNRATIARMIPAGAGIHVLSLGGAGGMAGVAQITGNRP